MSVTTMPSKQTERRRGVPEDPLRKPGWQVHTSVADAVRKAVEEGAAPSQNALVEQAVLRYLEDRRREQLFASYDEAARDPEFIADMRDTTRTFDSAVSDGLQGQ